MNGAESLLRTLVGCGVDVCFANPGTSEMHFVAALDSVPEMRAHLALFEGVATGAADGFARVSGRPAATLLHLGPGLGNGIANLHNARRARSPIVNLVGDHAGYHKRFDAPLESDIESLAGTVSGWFRRSARADDAGADAADAVAAASEPPGRVATLVVPADTGWSTSTTGPSPPKPVPRAPLVAPEDLEDVAKTLRTGEPTVLLLGGPALRSRGLVAASRIANATGARLMAETFPADLERGAGLPRVERLPYFGELVEGQLAGTRHLILAGTGPPAAFFAYPGKPSDLVPAGCEVHPVGSIGNDVAAALEGLAESLGAPPPELAPLGRPERPTGALTPESVAAAVGSLLPEAAVVVDESNTSGLFVAGATAGAPRHDWLTLTGGAIGQGLPLATGAAAGAPGRQVLCLESDGSAMYTIQSLWTQAREGLDVITLLFSNRSYAILSFELARVGAGTGGPRAHELLDLSRPDLDFVSMASGMGVPASRAADADGLYDLLAAALAGEGPSLIEVPL